ncbi:MAG: hypothetical protein PVH99_20230 [Desulfobacteraceae bacterium]|jgi:hypothetical protein
MTRINSLILVIKTRPVDPKKLFGISRFAGPHKRSKQAIFLSIREICLPREMRSLFHWGVFCQAEPASKKYFSKAGIPMW